MGAPKYNQKPSSDKQHDEEKQEVEKISNKIDYLMKDPEKFKKAMMIIEQMLNEGKKSS
jgi:hypothetical protein